MLAWVGPEAKTNFQLPTSNLEQKISGNRILFRKFDVERWKLDVGRSLLLITPNREAPNGRIVPYLYVGYPKAADHKKKISDSQNEGLKILTCCLTGTYISGNREKVAIRHAKRTLIVPKRVPNVTNRVQIVSKRVRIVPQVRSAQTVPVSREPPWQVAVTARFPRAIVRAGCAKENC